MTRLTGLLFAGVHSSHQLEERMVDRRHNGQPQPDPRGRHPDRLHDIEPLPEATDEEPHLSQSRELPAFKDEADEEWIGPRDDDDEDATTR